MIGRLQVRRRYCQEFPRQSAFCLWFFICLQQQSFPFLAAKMEQNSLLYLAATTIVLPPACRNQLRQHFTRNGELLRASNRFESRSSIKLLQISKRGPGAQDRVASQNERRKMVSVGVVSSMTSEAAPWNKSGKPFLAILCSLDFCSTFDQAKVIIKRY